MPRTRISVPEHLKDALLKAAHQLEQGHAVTLTPSEDGSVEIVYASTNQLVLNKKQIINAENARQQVFCIGDRVGLSSQADLMSQLVVKRVDAKHRIICSPLDRWGRADYTTEMVFEPHQIIMIQSFTDYLLHGLDITTISEDWAAMHATQQLRDELDKKLVEAKAAEAVLLRKRAKTISSR